MSISTPSLLIPGFKQQRAMWAVAALWLFVGSLGLAAPVPDSRPMAFDIPSLPLGEALRRYGEAVDLSVFFETSQVEDKRSSPVRGVMNRNDALRRLLDGTGMRARSQAGGVITVTPELAAPSFAVPDKGEPSPQYDGYLQTMVRQALCAEPGLRADTLRIALRFSVGPSRRVEGLRVSVDGQPSLEPSVRQALEGLRLTPPPPDVPQPVVMLITPQSAARWGGCPG